jgi:UDP-N-acetyl-D-mannosaminuronic acid transferase (WecB/TagA/CpsF family)
MNKSMDNEENYRIILGIRFFAGSARDAVRLGMQGGLVVAPSAPVLVAMVEDANTREALLHSHLALTDSGLMVLWWNFLQREDVQRVSGLEYLKLLLEKPELSRPGSVFLVMPTEDALLRSLAWLKQCGCLVAREDCYVAPHYGGGPGSDSILLQTLSERKPKHIIIAIGGGVQERLGYYLQQNLSHGPAIHCIGAAIGFLSGDQVRIPMWADRWILGWLFRCLSAPQKFIPRYWKARGLIPLLFKYRDRLPSIRQ